MADKKRKPLSAGRAKLEALGITLPPIPAAAAGALPMPQDLRELRYKVAKGVLPASELERKQKLATQVWIQQLDRTGLDVLVDGELDRSDKIAHFAERVDGFAAGGLVRVYGNRYYRKPHIRSKIQWKGSITVDQWKFAQLATHRPVKALLTGPYTLLEWSFNEHYDRKEDAIRDLIDVLRREIQALWDAGARIIQIDESALSSRPEEFPLVRDGIAELVKGFKAYFVLHHAYGALEPVWSGMTALPVDHFDLEGVNASRELFSLLKKHPTEKDLSIGVLDSLDPAVEPVRTVADRIRSALKNVPAGRLWVSPDGGLRTLTVEEAGLKLKTLVHAAQKVRTALR